MPEMGYMPIQKKNAEQQNHKNNVPNGLNIPVTTLAGKSSSIKRQKQLLQSKETEKKQTES